MNDKAIALPAGIKETDLTYSWRSKDKLVDRFDMYYTERFGWVIPTLFIRKTRRADRADRTYATTLDGKQCTVGLGPHVLRQVSVYVTEKRSKALQPFLDLKQKGAVDSNSIRDRISTRRAQTVLRRATMGGGDWWL